MILLLIKKSGQPFSELRFKKGPIYIGRQMGSQLFLPDPAVSRQHAVIYTSEEGDWVVEDLDSVNKTFLNQNAVHRAKLKDQDIIDISDFSIEFHIEQGKIHHQRKQLLHLDDTIMDTELGINTIVRLPETKDAPQIEIPAARIKDFSWATRRIYNACDLEGLHTLLIEIILKQFAALNAFAQLRKHPSGPMDIEGGRKITTQLLDRSELLGRYITEAAEKHRYILIPQLPRQIAKGTLRSIIVAPVLMDKDCYGVLYSCNSTKHEHYESADLDYLMLLSIQTAAVIQNLPE